jgi:hypothetical protein
LGVRQNWIDAGDIDTPVDEYRSQDGGYGVEVGRGQYVDMFPKYLSKIPLISDYITHKSPKEGLRQRLGKMAGRRLLSSLLGRRH